MLMLKITEECVTKLEGFVRSSIYTHTGSTANAAAKVSKFLTHMQVQSKAVIRSLLGLTSKESTYSIPFFKYLISGSMKAFPPYAVN